MTQYGTIWCNMMQDDAILYNMIQCYAIEAILCNIMPKYAI